MTQYNTLNVKLSNSQLYKLESGKKNGNKVTLKISSNAVGDFNYENIFPHKLLLTNLTQTLRHIKLLQTVLRLILNYQKPNCITQDN